MTLIYTVLSSAQWKRRLTSLGAADLAAKFDARETGDRYELHGELPGVSKEYI